MPNRPQITLSKEELKRASIPTNHVLVKMLHSNEGAKTKGGIVLGFLTDDVFIADGESHAADVAECYGEVYKTPEKLFFDPNDTNSMDWEVEMELEKGDIVWFSYLESKNSCQILCDGVIYKSIPYQDCYVAKRIVPLGASDVTVHVCLNGYVLCDPKFLVPISPLDVVSADKVDKTSTIIRYIGNAPKRYLRESYTHIEDLRVGDEVVLDHKTPLYLLERTKAFAQFEGDKLFWVCQRRRIGFILNRGK